jgi:hypothetical protein
MQDSATKIGNPYRRRFCSTLVILALSCLASFLAAQDTPVQGSPVQNLVQESTPHAKIARHSAAIPRTDFFPLESLDEETRKLSEQLLQKAMESEAFYTLIGQLKPVSEGFWGSYFVLDPLDTSEVDRVRAALRPWNIPEHYHADVLVYESPMRGQRYASAYVAHVPTLRALIQQHHNFFARWGITTATPPGEVIMAIEKCRQPDDRWRGFGRLFGYPEYAIDFFVNAGMHQRTTGEFVERDFRQIPTLGSRTGRFVYAAPKLSRPGDEDLALERRATLLLSEYRSLRSQATGAKLKPIELLRDWMDDGQGYCHPQHLVDKLPTKTNEELDAEIAREKASVASAPVVKFNHLYIVLDQATFESIRQSEFVTHQLAASDQGFPKFEPVDDQCQAIYLRGQDTYLELFGPQNKFNEPVGKIGLGWSVESVGELEQVAERLRHGMLPKN